MLDTPVSETPEKNNIVQELRPWLEKSWIEVTLMQYFDDATQKLDHIEEIAILILSFLEKDWARKVLVNPYTHTLELTLQSWEKRVFDLLTVSEKYSSVWVMWWVEKNLSISEPHSSEAETLWSRESLNLEILKDAEQLDMYIGVLDSLFQTNKKDWFWNKELNNKDSVSATIIIKEEVRWLNIAQVAQKVRQQILIIDSKLANTNWSISQDKLWDILENKSRYLEMTMGIWKVYERWASAFAKTWEEVDKILEEITENKTPRELLDYLTEIHQKIASNDTKSESNIRWYRLFTQSLHSIIYDRFRRFEESWSKGEESAYDEEQKGLSDKFMIEFIEIITGRKIVETHDVRQRWQKIGKKVVKNNIDDKFKDTTTANLMLAHLINRPGGILEKLEQDDSFQMNDEKVWARSAKEVFSDLQLAINTFSKRFPWFDIHSYLMWYAKDWKKLEGMFDLPDEKYSELKMSDRIIVSYLARIEEFLSDHKQLERVDKFLKLQKQENEGIEITSSSWYNDILGFVEYELPRIFEKSVEEVSDLFEHNFDSKLSDSSTWLQGQDASVYWIDVDFDIKTLELYNDINGMWFDLSDTWDWFVKWWWEIVAVLAASIAVWWGAWLILRGAWMWWGAIMQGMLISGVSWPIWNAMTGKGYDTNEEMWADIKSDALINIPLWAAWWAATRFIWSDDLNVFSNLGVNKNNLIFSWDLSIWMWAEMWRMSKLDKRFHGESFFENAWKNFDKR